MSFSKLISQTLISSQYLASCTFMLSCASWRARTRASKLKNTQNSILIKREYISDHFEHFKIFRACAFVCAFYARAARTDSRNSVPLTDFDSWYIKDQYPLIFSHFWQIIRSCERVKVRNPRARLWANTCKNHDILYWALAPQNAGWPPIFITCIERLWVVDVILYSHLPVRMLWRHHNVIQTQKNEFPKNTKRFFTFEC